MTLIDFILSILNHGKTSLAEADLNTLCRADRSGKFKALYPLLYHELTKIHHTSIPQILKDSFYASLQYMTWLKAEYEELQKVLKQNQIEFMTYKGFDFAERFYEIPETRPMIDVDLLIRKRDLPKIMELLPKQRYQYISSETLHHLYRKNGVNFELHTDLFHYQRMLFFGLEGISIEDAINSNKIRNEVCLLIAAYQYYTPFHARLIPLIDIYFVLQKGINLSAWNKLMQQCNAEFLILFCHHSAKAHFGIALFPDNMLKCIRAVHAKREDKIALIAQAAKKSSETYPIIFAMTKSRFWKAFRLLFPPKEVFRYYAKGKISYLKHLLRIWRRIKSMFD